MAIYAEVHYYDAKGRYYRLDNLREELKNLGIEVGNIRFNDDYDGYVEIFINSREQARMLDSKYGTKLYIIGANYLSKAKTIDDAYDNAGKLEMFMNKYYSQSNH